MFLKYFHLREAFCEITFCALDNHNTLRGLIKANIRTVTMETFQKIILPKYGHQHENNLLVPCFTVYNQQFTPQEFSKVFFMVSNYIFSSFK